MAKGWRKDHSWAAIQILDSSEANQELQAVSTSNPRNSAVKSIIRNENDLDNGLPLVLSNTEENIGKTTFANLKGND